MPETPLAARIVDLIERHRQLNDPVSEPRNGYLLETALTDAS